MKTIHVEDIEEFLDYAEKIEVEHKRMRRALKKLLRETPVDDLEREKTILQGLRLYHGSKRGD